MKTENRFRQGLLCFALSFSLQSGAQNAPLLSNLLPRPLLNEMSEAGLPILALDDNGSREQAELARFWKTLNAQKLDPQEVVDQVFGAEIRSFSRQERELYTMKYLMLRYSAENTSSPAKHDELQASLAAFKNRYLSSSAIVISLSDFEEVKQISAAFFKKLAAKEVSILDLSPKLRSSISQSDGESHGIKLSERLPNSRRFQVSGFYQANSGSLAVDFSRSVEENLVTLFHEMVHAADPRLEQYRADFKKLWPDVAKILVRFTSNPEQSVPLDSLDHAFQKAELSKLESILVEARQNRLQNLEKTVLSAKLSDAEKITLEKWVRCAIGLTVENEFRAYALSIVLYNKLRSRYQLFVDNLSVLREFSEKLIAGDQSFALRISSDVAGLDRIHHFISSSLSAKNEEERFIRQILESFYLKGMESFITTLGNQYSKELPKTNNLASERRSELPDWARPGGFDLPTNPYQILTARISTSWTVAFANSLKRIHDELMSINEPLWLLNAGILDLHDINIGELKVLGLHFVGSPFSSYPKELPERLRLDVSELHPNLQNLFELNHFNPTVRLDGESIKGSELREKLIGLRLAKANLWMEESLPPLSNSLLGTKGFIEKLRNGIAIDHGEISESRQQELLTELDLALDKSRDVYDQMSVLRMIGAKLGNFTVLAENSRLNQLASEFQKKTTYVQSVIENYGIDSKDAQFFERIKANLARSQAEFLGQLSKIRSDCKELHRRRQLGYFPASGPYTVEGYSFSPMIVCWNERIYAVRQPGDFSKFMTTTLRDNKPHSRIFMGARPVELEALGSVQDTR